MASVSTFLHLSSQSALMLLFQKMLQTPVCIHLDFMQSYISDIYYNHSSIKQFPEDFVYWFQSMLNAETRSSFTSPCMEMEVSIILLKLHK